MDFYFPFMKITVPPSAELRQPIQRAAVHKGETLVFCTPQWRLDPFLGHGD